MHTTRTIHSPSRSNQGGVQRDGRSRRRCRVGHRSKAVIEKREGEAEEGEGKSFFVFVVPFNDSLTHLSRRRKKLKPPQRKPPLPKRPPFLLDPPLQNLQNQHIRNQKLTKMERTMKKVPPPVPRATKRRKRKSQRRRRSLLLPPRRRWVPSVR